MAAVLKPRWSPSSYLTYAGGLTVLGAALGALSYLAGQYGDAAYAAWALLVFAGLAAIALGLRRRESALAAGVFAFVDVLAFTAFVAALWHWWGWLPASTASSSPFAGFHVGLLSLELLTIVAALVARRAFRHPLPSAIVAFLGWLFVTDAVSNGGSWSAVVTLLVGLLYLVAGTAVDRGPRRPYGFWLHLVAGLAIGGSLLYWWHAGDTRWALVCVASLVFVGIAGRTRRSSWAVLATIGLFAAATHFSGDWAHTRIAFGAAAVDTFRGWVPALVFAFVGFLLVALGLLARRRDPDDALAGSVS